VNSDPRFSGLSLRVYNFLPHRTMGPGFRLPWLPAVRGLVRTPRSFPFHQLARPSGLVSKPSPLHRLSITHKPLSLRRFATVAPIERTIPRSLPNWLFGCSALVFGILVVGGLTRLSESGLSIVEWNLVTGIRPPITDSEWAAEWEKYKISPEGIL